MEIFILIGIAALILWAVIAASGKGEQAGIEEARRKRKTEDEAREKYERAKEEYERKMEEFERMKLLPHEVTEKLIEGHLKTLTKKAKQKIIIDDYGNTIMDEWDKEIEYFAKRVVIPELERSMADFANELDIELTQLEAKTRKKGADDADDKAEPGKFDIDVVIGIKELINERVLPLLEIKGHPETKEISGIDFEHMCVDVLRENGWDARVTKGSGDQGIDVIAERDETSVVLQCKRHSSPVGNKAVQEVFAGQEFEDADFAAVVSNVDYTTAARQLANKNGVILLHYDDLPDLWDKVHRGFK